MYAILNLEGRLVADPDFRTGKEDREYCTLRVAVNQKLGPQENTAFYSCTGGEFIAKRIRKAGFTKGQLIQIVGNLTLREYTDKAGAVRTSADVGILDWHFVTSKPKGSAEDVSPADAAPAPAGKVEEEVYIGTDDDELPL